MDGIDDELRAERLEALRRATDGSPTTCFHNAAGKACTRYLEGSRAERASIVAWLRWEADHRPAPTDQRLRDAAGAVERGEHGKPRDQGSPMPSAAVDPGVRCDACGKIVARETYRAIDANQGRCVPCSDAGVPYGEYLRRKARPEATPIPPDHEGDPRWMTSGERAADSSGAASDAAEEERLKQHVSQGGALLAGPVSGAGPRSGAPRACAICAAADVVFFCDACVTKAYAPGPADVARCAALFAAGTVYEEAVLVILRMLADVRRETIAQCKAAHDAGIPWGSPFTRKAGEP